MWNLEATCSLRSRKSFAFDHLLVIHELAPLIPAFPALITTQQAGIYPKSSLGFAIYLVRFYDFSGHINVPDRIARKRYVGT